MWTIKREREAGSLMGILEYVQIIFLVAVVGIGLVGFMRAVNDKDDE